MKGPVRDPATYAFNAAARTITFTAPIPAFQGYILGVTNVTRGVLIYLPIDPELIGTYNSGTGVLTLAFDTTGQANGDILQVIYDDTTSSASSALQAVANASLANIDAELGAPTDAPAATPTATASIGSLIRLGLQNAATGLTNWTTLLGRVPTLVSGRIPVDGSSVTQPVSGPLTDAQLRASAPSVAPNITRAAGASDADTQRVVLASDSPGVASLSSLDAKMPALVSGRQPVDGSAVTQPVSVAVRTPVTTSVASTATSTTLLASNSNRRGLFIYNDSTALLRVSFSTPATAGNSFVGVPPSAFLILDPLLIGTDALYGIWGTANGTAQVTEWS